MSYFGEKMSDKDLLNLFKNQQNRTGYFEVATVLAFPDGKTINSIFKVNFTLSEQSKGELQSGWNRIIMLEGETRTLAEYPESEATYMGTRI